MTSPTAPVAAPRDRRVGVAPGPARAVRRRGPGGRAPRTHALKLDRTTLPAGARPLKRSCRTSNLGSAIHGTALPAKTQPLLVPALPFEGQWLPIARAGGQDAIWATSMRDKYGAESAIYKIRVRGDFAGNPDGIIPLDLIDGFYVDDNYNGNIDGTAGIYLNVQAIRRLGFGDSIGQEVKASSAFAGVAAVLPPGASVMPQAGSPMPGMGMPGMPAAPVAPAAPPVPPPAAPPSMPGCASPPRPARRS